VNEFLNQHKAEIEQILAKYPAGFKRSAVMPLLYIAQRERGYVTPAVMAEIAEVVGISSTEVGSVAGFYSLFYEEPEAGAAGAASGALTPLNAARGRYRIQVCNDLPCAMRGADEFLQQVCDYLGIGTGETSADGLFTVEAVKCLAACHRAPMFQVQGDGELVYHEQQTLESAKAWIEKVRQRIREKEWQA